MTWTPGLRPEARQRAGATIVLISFGIIALVFFCALSVDVGYWYYQRAQLQTICDLAALSALGSLNDKQSLANQQAFIRNQLNLIAVGNGYQSGQFVPTFSVTTSNAYGTSQQVVQAMTVNVSQTVPTFFWRMANVASIRISAAARVERTGFAAPGSGQLDDGSCYSVVALGNLDLQGPLIVDSYDSRFGSGVYNPTNTPPSGGTRRFHRGNAVLVADGNLTRSGANNIYGSVRIQGNVDLRSTYLNRKGLNPPPNPPGLGARQGTLQTNGATVLVGTLNTTTALVDTIALAPLEPSNNMADYDNGLITRSGTFTTFTNNTATGVLNAIANAGGNAVIMMPAGRRYRFTSFNTDVDVRIRITGSTTAAKPTQIWWDATAGTMTIDGGITLDSGEATDLVIFGVSDRPIALTAKRWTSSPASSTTYAQIYAPLADVTVATNNSTSGNPAQFVGQIVGFDVTFQAAAANDRFLYDESLGCASGVESNAPGGVSVDVHLVQ